MLEEIVNLKLAMKHNKPKSVVLEKWNAYHNAYVEKEKSVWDKQTYRDLFLDYIRYMSKSGEGGK